MRTASAVMAFIALLSTIASPAGADVLATKVAEVGAGTAQMRLSKTASSCDQDGLLHDPANPDGYYHDAWWRFDTNDVNDFGDRGSIKTVLVAGPNGQPGLHGPWLNSAFGRLRMCGRISPPPGARWYQEDQPTMCSLCMESNGSTVTEFLGAVGWGGQGKFEYWDSSDNLTRTVWLENIGWDASQGVINGIVTLRGDVVDADRDIIGTFAAPAHFLNGNQGSIMTFSFTIAYHDV